MRILLCCDPAFAQECEPPLRAALGAFACSDVQLDVVGNAEFGEPAGFVARYDYLLAWRPPPGFFARHASGDVLPRAVFVLGAGVDALLAMPDLPAGLPVIRLEDAGMARPMADYVLAAVLHVHRRFDVYSAQQRAGVWKPRLARPPCETRIGVLGIGAIGGEVVRLLAAHGYAVRGFGRTARPADALTGVELHHGVASAEEAQRDGSPLRQFLHGLHFLVNVMPSTALNRGVLGRAAFNALDHGAHVINVGRGVHLVEADLCKALDDGQLAGATLDVFSTEPLPQGHPFWSRPEIVMTPHASAVTEIDPGMAQIAHKILALERGEVVSGIVDRGKGY
jgi:glyoxylate/hydroxypyruvate reductase A